MFKEMLTLDEAAEYIGSSKSLFYKMTASRGITHYKPNGRVIYIDRKDLDELLRTNPVYSKKALERQAIAATMEMSEDKPKKTEGRNEMKESMIPYERIYSNNRELTQEEKLAREKFRSFLEHIRIRATDHFVYPPEILTVDEITIATVGNFSASVGKPTPR